LKRSLRFHVLLGLSLGSGVAALIYEIVWFQVLELAIGTSAVSAGLGLAMFLGGACLGSLLLPHRLGTTHPLRAYAALEIGIALCGGLVLWAAPALSAQAPEILTAACILPAALLMGAALPVLSRDVAARPPRGVGRLYAAKIVGGVVGCVAAGFWLIPSHDLITAAAVAATINAVAAVVAWYAAAAAPSPIPMPASVPASGTVRLELTIAISGLCALGSQTLWNRTLGLLFGASAYTLAIVIAMFLAGLGVGSAFGSRRSEAITHPAHALAWCQILAAAAMAWGGLSHERRVSVLADRSVDRLEHRIQLSDRHLSGVVELLPATFLWGASFPLALAASAPATGTERTASVDCMGQTRWGPSSGRSR
jgi:spermidine synthase